VSPLRGVWPEREIRGIRYTHYKAAKSTGATLTVNNVGREALRRPKIARPVKKPGKREEQRNADDKHRAHFEPIENYGVIGNMRTVALVSTHGSIDLFCFPKFDSPTVFASLLDPDSGGCFSIHPALKNSRTKQLYLPNTNILITRFLSDDGIAEMTDFMPIISQTFRSHVVRKVSVIKGEIEFTLRCEPRFDYGRAKHKVRRAGNCLIFKPQHAKQPELILNASIELEVHDGVVLQKFTLKAGQTAVFAFGESTERARAPIDNDRVEMRFQETARFWREWIGRSNYKGRWREMVSRSALVLKLLTDRESGSLIAAPTFGLPEKIGGPRNWDYRYTWLRDSAFTLYALMRLGFLEEATHFQQWINARLKFDAKGGPLQTLYRTDGGTETPEIELKNLCGYRHSKPVRIGNAAYKQLQLDVYGELMDAIYLASKYGDGLGIDEWNSTKRMLRWLSKNWNQPDEGIWEVRGGRRHFLHSRIMCWVAFDRAIRLGEKRSLAGPFDWMLKARDDIYEDIVKHFWSEKRQAFVQYKGSDRVDAAVLLMPLVRFISPTDPKWLATLAAIEKELAVDTLVYRYRDQGRVDGLPGSEGTFTACSFWFIEALARSGQLEKAQILFEKMTGYANHVGLYAEQLGESGEHLGNFPQALTHLALISAATYLDRALSGKREPWQ
jgi:GH15 family glucan-1,4-alpha-glucosidase